MNTFSMDVPRQLLRNVPFMIGLTLFCLVMGLLVLSVTALRADPLAIVAAPYIEPGWHVRFPLGTDMLGRDVAVQLAHGARISLQIGICATALSVFLGVLIGTLGGYFGGYADLIATRVTELFQTLPNLLLAIVLTAVMTPSVWSVVLAIGLTSWTQIARVVRPEVMRLKQTDFVHAASIAGMSHWQIIRREILPNIGSTVIVLASILIANAILTESALSFLGLGDPNLISWGAMIGEGRLELYDAWYVCTFPGIATLVTVLSFTLLGNGLNDILNRRLGVTRSRRDKPAKRRRQYRPLGHQPTGETPTRHSALHRH